MNRTLKRPMFRMGGSIGTGITSGLDKPRKQFSEGTNNPLLQYPTDYFPELGVKKQETTPSITIDKPQETTSMLPSEQLMKAFADRDTKPDLSQFLINFGLNLASATPRGNIIATAAEAAKAPTDTLFKQIGAEKAFDRQLALSGAEMDINERLKKEAAQRKFEQDLALQLAKPQKLTYRQGVDTRTGQRGFFTDAQIEAADGAIQPIDNRMGFVFDAKTQTLKQVPLSDLDRAKDKKEEAMALATQYNILTELIGDMQTRLPGLVTGPTGNIFGFVEGSADQFRQIAESLGVRDGLVIEDDSVINKYLKDKGFTEKASDFAQMKSSVINLGYALAKIAEPDNPRLSEGDIIRQLNRINFGSSRKVFSDSLNQILKEELIRAQAEIKGKELNPDDFINVSKKDKGKDTDNKKTTEDDNDPFNIR
jgi:hypothetical protein